MWDDAAKRIHQISRELALFQRCLSHVNKTITVNILRRHGQESAAGRRPGEMALPAKDVPE